MSLLTYTFSPVLKSSLEKIESLRKEILLIPLTPQMEIELRFEAIIDRIYLLWSLDDKPLNKHTLRNLFSSQAKKMVNREVQEILDYHKALDWISWNWLASEETISPKTVLELYNLACLNTSGKPFDFSAASLTINYFLEYLEKGKEHPVIQAGIAYIQLMHIGAFGEDTKKIAHLLSYLFLYKHYYNLRGLLIMEEYWKQDFLSYKKNYQAALENENVNIWLEYFVASIINSSENVIHTLSLPHVPSQSAAFSRLNERQKEILALLENPKETITNRKVQQVFRMSQITASRDLTRLANMGLILTYGKGRSVYYTRA